MDLFIIILDERLVITTSTTPTPIPTPTTYLAFGLSSNIIGGLPPLDSPILLSIRKSSSIKSFVIFVTLAGVNPVNLAISARDRLPLSFITLSTAETFNCFINSKLPFNILFMLSLLY